MLLAYPPRFLFPQTEGQRLANAAERLRTLKAVREWKLLF